MSSGLLGCNKAISEGAEQRSGDRSNPKEPKLINGPIAYEQCDASASSGID